MKGAGPSKKLFKSMSSKAGKVKKTIIGIITPIFTINVFYYVFAKENLFLYKRHFYNNRELMLQVHCTRRTAIAGKNSGLANAALFILKEMLRCGS